MAHFLLVQRLAFVPNIFLYLVLSISRTLTLTHKRTRSGCSLTLVFFLYFASLGCFVSFRLVVLMVSYCVRAYYANRHTKMLRKRTSENTQLTHTSKLYGMEALLKSWSIEANGKLHPFHISIYRFLLSLLSRSQCVFSGLHLTIFKVYHR